MTTLSRWFLDTESPPSIPGVYEVEPDDSSPWYSFWDGQHWHRIVIGDIDKAASSIGEGFKFSSLTWRGLAEDPSETQP